ncbi:MAG: M56 family metallopeptidase [Candidatus Latescibacterota bacterium]
MWEAPFMEWIPAFSGFIFPYWANLMVHSTALIIFGILIARALRGRGAAVESLVLRLTLLAVLASPLASVAISSMGIRGMTVPAPHISLEKDYSQNNGGAGDGFTVISAAGVSSQESKALLSGGLSAVSGNGGERTPVRPAAAFPGSLFRNLMIAVTLLWVVVSLFFAGRLAVCFFLIQRIRNSATDAPPPTVRECWHLSRIMEVEPPLILQSPAVRSPFLTGLRRPVVLLPVCAGGEEPVGREVLLHELAHLARKDCFWNLLAHLSIAALSLQPLVRALARRIEDVSDDACDDYVVHSGASRQDYARRLFAVAERFRPSIPEMTMGVGIVTFQSSLGRRIARILDSSRNLRIHPGFGTALRLTVLCIVTTALVGLTGFQILGDESSGEPVRSEILRIVALLDSASPLSEGAPPVAEPDNTLLLTKPGMAKADARLPLTVELPAQPSGTAGNPGQAWNDSPETPANYSMNREAPVQTAYLEPMPSATDAPSPAAERMEKTRTSAETEKSAPGKNAGASQQKRDASLPPEPGRQAAEPLSREKEALSPPPAPGRDPVFLNQLTNLKTCLKIGEQMIESGKYGEAEEAYLAALGFEPNNPEVMNRLGRVYYLQRAYDKAAACLAIAISSKPDQHTLADAHYNMGDVLLARGDLNKAMKSYKTAIQINPAYAKRARAFY